MKISVIGSGAWGSTLAAYLYKNGNDVALWEFNPKQLSFIKTRRHPMFFPFVKIDRRILLTGDLETAVRSADIILICVPSQSVRSTVRAMSGFTNPGQIFLIASKGIEIETGKRLSEVIKEEIAASKTAALSGPSFAKEVALGLPTTIVAAGEKKHTMLIQKEFSSKYLRIYTNTDITGVEIGGAVKNVIAIACGIAHGLGLGDNAAASIITRGLAEITRLGVKLGAEKSTFSGLSGLGDILMTSFSANSRNRNFGELIGKGINTNQAIKKIGMVVEGVPTTKAVINLSKKTKVEMPITDEIYKILFRNKNPEAAIIPLMTRDMKSE